MSVVPWDKLDPAESPYVKLFGLIGIPFAAGIINFVVNSSGFITVVYLRIAVMFGLAGRNQGPPFLHKTNKNGVPYNAILVTCGLLGIAVILNAILKMLLKYSFKSLLSLLC